MATFESLPVELVSQILAETDISSLINVSGLSRRLRYIVSDSTLNPWRGPILRNLLSGTYEESLNHLSVRYIVPRKNWIEIISIARSSYLLFETTLPNLKDSEWEECFRRRFLPSWARWKKNNSWRATFLKILHRVWHRTHSSCTSDEAWTKFLVLNRNSTANRIETSSRNLNPVTIFDGMKLQNNLTQFKTRIRVVVQFADLRILAFGVLNSPKTAFSVNENAWSLLHPPRVRLPEPAGHTDSQESSFRLDDSAVSLHFDPEGPSRLRHPQPKITSHRNYPMYTPSGWDRRWVQPKELEKSNLKWVGSMMLIAQLVGPLTMESWSESHPLQDEYLIVGSGRNQYASLSWEDLSAIAPWMDELITKKLDEAGLGH